MAFGFPAFSFFLLNNHMFINPGPLEALLRGPGTAYQCRSAVAKFGNCTRRYNLIELTLFRVFTYFVI